MPMAQKTPGYGKSSMNNNVFLKRVSPNQPKLIGRFFVCILSMVKYPCQKKQLTTDSSRSVFLTLNTGALAGALNFNQSIKKRNQPFS